MINKIGRVVSDVRVSERTTQRSGDLRDERYKQPGPEPITYPSSDSTPFHLFAQDVAWFPRCTHKTHMQLFAFNSVGVSIKSAVSDIFHRN